MMNVLAESFAIVVVVLFELKCWGNFYSNLWNSPEKIIGNKCVKCLHLHEMDKKW